LTKRFFEVGRSVSLVVRRYDPSLRETWDDFVRRSKNGTFLFLRNYMEYHRERFRDHSLLIMNDAQPVALLPAHRTDDAVHSHEGLTYGGLVTANAMTTPLMLDTFAAVLRHLQADGMRHLFYKTIPTIYHHCPAEEDRYALFLADGILYRRDVLSVIPRGAAAPVQMRRRRGAARATKLGVAVEKSNDWGMFWPLLSNNLKRRFGVVPVHNVAEIEELARRFPENISLHVAGLDAEILAGVVIYESAMVAHVQYIAASPRGREVGALDQLVLHLLRGPFAQKAYFDFGASNELQGRFLNRGLVEQKEGFGARAVVHDFYRLELGAGE
jgi:hypothetical protein